MVVLLKFQYNRHIYFTYSIIKLKEHNLFALLELSNYLNYYIFDLNCIIHNIYIILIANINNTLFYINNYIN